MLVMLLIGAFCTAAYMTRTIWYAFYGEYRGHGTPHESGPRITVPLIILATLGAVVGVLNLPKEIGPIEFPESLHTQFEHFVEPVGAVLPRASATPSSTSRWRCSRWSSPVLGIGLTYLYYWKDGLSVLHGPGRSATAWPGWGKNVLVNKYYFDWLYTDVIVGFVKGPARTRRQLVQRQGPRRRSSTASARARSAPATGSTTTSTRRSSTVP